MASRSLLTQTFAHLPGVGPTREKKWWALGILNWDALEGRITEVAPAEVQANGLRTALEQSRRALDAHDLYYFYQTLPRDQAWRVLPNHFDQIAYLDIETTGLGYPPASQSTTITIYYRSVAYQEYQAQAKVKLLKKILAECQVIATFFGSGFDIPFLSREFDLRFEKPHVDLCIWFRRLGYKGGLKKIQKLFPNIPSRHSMDLDGYDAVRLWRLHQQGVEGALETLLHYNAEDTVVLEPLLAEAYNRQIELVPELNLKPIDVPRQAELSTKIHPEVYRKLRA